MTASNAFSATRSAGISPLVHTESSSFAPFSPNLQANKAEGWMKAPVPSVMARNGIVVAVNNAALEALGLRKESILDQPVAKFLGSDSPSTPTLSPAGSVSSLQSAGYPARSMGTTPSNKEVDSEVTIHWLRQGRTRAISSFSLRGSGSPDAARLARTRMRGHEVGHAAALAMAGVPDEVQNKMVAGFKKIAQVDRDLSLLAELELDTVEVKIAESTLAEQLKTTLQEDSLVPYLSRIFVSQESLSLMNQELSLDWGKFSFIILRLTENACKHTKGPVYLTFKYDPLTTKLQASVKDEGVGEKGEGINQSYLKDAIDAETLKSGTHTTSSRSGYIFRICYMMSELLGGQMECESGRGTVFNISVSTILPRAPDTVELPVEPQVPSPAGASRTLLLPPIADAATASSSPPKSTTIVGSLAQKLRSLVGMSARADAYAAHSEVSSSPASTVSTSVLAGTRTTTGPVLGPRPQRPISPPPRSLTPMRTASPATTNSSMGATPPRISTQATPPRTLPPLVTAARRTSDVTADILETGMPASRPVKISPREEDATPSLFGSRSFARSSPVASGAGLPIVRTGSSGGGDLPSLRRFTASRRPPLHTASVIAAAPAPRGDSINLATLLSIPIPLNVSDSTSEAGSNVVVDSSSTLSATRVTNSTKIPYDAPVLWVDDEKSIRLTMARFVKKAGLTNVTFVEDGMDAYALVQAAAKAGNPIRFIFMDQMMEPLNGTQTAVQILKKHPEIIIIPATGNASEEEKAAYRAAGMQTDPMVVKLGVNVDAIKAVVRHYFDFPESPAAAGGAGAS